MTHRPARWTTAGLIGWVLLAPGCFRPSEQRAERDLQVGHGKEGGASVSVRGGLAAIRSLSDGKLALWGSAPTMTVDMQLTASASPSWTIELRNAMPGADLVVEGDATATPSSSPVPTRKVWQLQLNPPQRVSLHIATPESDAQGSFRVAVLSDIQEAVDRVQDIFDRIDAEPDLAFVWTSGDLSENGSAEQMDRVQDELRWLEIPMFGTLGNHDTFRSPTPWHGRFGRCNVHFIYRGVRFTAVDSADGTLDPMVYDWLSTWLEDGRQGTHLFVTHVPILDPIGVRGGGFASRNEAAKLLSKLAEGRVDATFYGHIHSYYAFENAGIPAYISGGGGAIPERFDGIGRHFLIVQVDAIDGVQSVSRVDVD